MKSRNSFNEKCYSILKRVPKGKVTTYKSLAQAMKSKAYRAVGNAMNKNPYSYSAWGRAGGSLPADKLDRLVPCHRVVKANGEIGGFASGTKNKIKILRNEGVGINEGKVDLNKYEYSFT